jgi:hypothetical protein
VDAGFKERVTAAFDGLAARYDTERGGFFGPVSDLLVRAVALLEPLRAPDGSLRRGLGFCYTRAAAAVSGPANPSARPEAR